MSQFIKNIFKFMKRSVVSNKEEVCCNEENAEKPVKKSRWMSHDQYLEKKYKRIKIYNGETNSNCTPQMRFGDGKTVTVNEVPKKCCVATKAEKCYYSNTKEKKNKQFKLQQRCHRETNKRMQEEEEDESETDIETESVNEDDDNDSENAATQRPKRKTNKKKKRINSCQQLDEKLLELILVVREKCLRKKFAEIEHNASTLWNNFSTKLPQCQNNNALNKDWHCLKCTEKLPFYWAAISGTFLHENPFDNFLRYYLDEYGFEDKYMQNCKFMQHVRKLWLH